MSEVGFPEFPTVFTERDTKRLGQVEEQKRKMEEVYQTKFTEEAWTKMPTPERKLREFVEGTPLSSVVQIFTPWKWGWDYGVTPEEADMEMMEVEEEYKELIRREKVTRLYPVIQNTLRAFALSGEFIPTDPSEIKQYFKMDELGFTQEEINHISSFAFSLLQSSPEDVAMGGDWGMEAMTKDDWESLMKQSHGVDPRFILSTVAFSKNLEVINSALEQAYPAKGGVDVPSRKERILEEYLEEIEPKEGETKADAVKRRFEELAKEAGETIVIADEESGVMVNGNKKSDGSVWVDGELWGDYNEETKDIVPYSFTTGEPLVTEGAKESALKDMVDALILSGAEQGTSFMEAIRHVFPASELLKLKKHLSSDVPYDTSFEGVLNVLTFTPLYKLISSTLDNKTKVKLIEGLELGMAKLRGEHDKRLAEFGEWKKDNPELQPRPEFAGSAWERVKTDPKCLLDPAYLGYLMADNAATAAAFAVTIGVAYTTKNPYLTMAVGSALFTPLETNALYEDLMASGATYEQALAISPIGGGAIASIESLGSLPIARSVSPLFFKAFRKKAVNEFAKLSVRQLGLKGAVTTIGKQALTIQAAEVTEEILQEVVHNAFVKTIDENRDLLMNIPETFIRSMVAILPLAIGGGGMHYHRVKMNLSTEEREELEHRRDGHIAEGIPEVKAEHMALNEKLETETGKIAVEAAIEKTDKEIPVEPVIGINWDEFEWDEKISNEDRGIIRGEFDLLPERMRSNIKGIVFNPVLPPGVVARWMPFEGIIEFEDLTTLKTPSIFFHEVAHSLVAEKFRARELEVIDAFAELYKVKVDWDYLIKRTKEEYEGVVHPIISFNEHLGNVFYEEYKKLEEDFANAFSDYILVEDILTPETKEVFNKYYPKGEYKSDKGKQATDLQYKIEKINKDIQDFNSLLEKEKDDSVREIILTLEQQRDELIRVKNQINKPVQTFETGTPNELSTLKEKLEDNENIKETLTIYQQLRDLLTKWKDKDKNISNLERDLEKIDPDTIDLSEVTDAIDTYKAIETSDYGNKEDYQKEKDYAWKEIISKIQDAELNFEELKELSTEEVSWTEERIAELEKAPVPTPEPTEITEEIVSETGKVWDRLSPDERLVIIDSAGIARTTLGLNWNKLNEVQQARISERMEAPKPTTVVPGEIPPIKPPPPIRVGSEEEGRLPPNKRPRLEDWVDEQAGVDRVLATNPKIAKFVKLDKKEIELKNIAERTWNNASGEMREELRKKLRLKKTVVAKSWDELTTGEKRPLVLSLNTDRSITFFGIKEFLDMEYFMQSLQKTSGYPFYDILLRIESSVSTAETVKEKALKEITEDPHFTHIIKDEGALKRVAQEVNARNIVQGVEHPTDISDEEILLADRLLALTEKYKPIVRYLRVTKPELKTIEDFKNEFPDAVENGKEDELGKALELRDLGDLDNLWEFILDCDWGVYEHGFDPRYITAVDIRPKKGTLKATRGEGRLLRRESIKYEEGKDARNIMRRHATYIEQMEIQWRITADLNVLADMWGAAGEKISNWGEVKHGLEMWVERVQGIPPVYNWFDKAVRKIWRQSMVAVFFEPVLALRNSFQPILFHMHRTELIRLLFDKLPADTKLIGRLYFDSIVSQLGGLRKDWLHTGEHVAWFIDPLNTLVDKVTMYGHSDNYPRLWSFMAYLNKAQRATQQYLIDGNVGKWLKNSGAMNLRQEERNYVLTHYLGRINETFSLGLDGLNEVPGSLMASLYLAKRGTDVTHFKYRRYGRGIIEMGATGETLWNLVAFPRGYAQRLTFQAEKIQKVFQGEGSWEEARTGFNDIMKLAAVSVVFGALWKNLTGRDRNPYDLLNILFGWQFGGLFVGVVQDVTGLVSDIVTAVAPFGENKLKENALNRIPAQISRLHETLIPFSRRLVDIIEVAMGTESKIDVYTFRKIRGYFDERYTPEELDAIDRNTWEMLGKGVLGRDIPDATKVEQIRINLQEAEANLGMLDENYKNYTLKPFGNYIESQIEPLSSFMVDEDKGWSDLTVFYRTCMINWEGYRVLPTVPSNIRTDWRKDNIEAEASLIFWGKVNRSVFHLYSPEGQEVLNLLHLWTKVYGIEDTEKPFADWRTILKGLDNQTTI